MYNLYEDLTTYTEEIAESYRKKLIEYYKNNNLEQKIIQQVEEYDTEALLCMAARDAINMYEERIDKIKEEQKQH